MNIYPSSIIWQNGRSLDVKCSMNMLFLADGSLELCSFAATCPAWDRCFVCRGNDTCVGCDGVPFGQPSGCIPTKGNLIAPSRGNTNLQYTGIYSSLLLLFL